MARLTKRTPSPLRIPTAWTSLTLMSVLLISFAGADEPIFENVLESTTIAGTEFVSWCDFDNDGNVDVVAGGKLFRNLGEGRFEIVESFPGGTGVWGDYDNDGKVDFYSIGGEGVLYRGLGDGRFEKAEIGANKHQHCRAAAWGDANNDGFIDLYVSNYEIWPARAFPDLLFMNQGDGTFADAKEFAPGGSWRARGVNWSDFDHDGDQDFYVSNYRLMPNHLWVNDGNGNFTEEAKVRGVRGTDDEAHIPASDDTPQYNVSGHTIGSCFGDLNNDGHIDLVVVNFAHPPELQDRTMIYINSGPPNYTFTNINEDNAAGIHYQESYAKGALGDYDNDGDLDLYISTVYPNDDGTLFENDGTGKFTDVGDKAGLRGSDGYGVAWVDYDNDGDLDLSTSGALLRNRGNDNSWVKVNVIADAGSNRSAIGSRVIVRAGDATYVREVQAGNSGNQEPFVVHVGLGTHQEPIAVEVQFPSGKRSFWNTKPNLTVDVYESNSEE